MANLERLIVLTASKGEALQTPLVESDVRDARTELAGNPDTYAATIDARISADHDADSMDSQDSNSKLSWLLGLGDLVHHEALVFLLGSSRAHVTISRGHRGIHVIAWVHEAPHLDTVYESVLSLLQRVRGSSKDLEELSEDLMAQLLKLSIRELGIRQGSAVQLSNVAIASEGTGAAKRALEHLRDERLWLSAVAECAIECEDQIMREAAARQSDSNALSISLLQSKLLLLLSEQAERNEASRANQSRNQAASDNMMQEREKERDRKLARWALALVFRLYGSGTGARKSRRMYPIRGDP